MSGFHVLITVKTRSSRSLVSFIRSTQHRFKMEPIKGALVLGLSLCLVACAFTVTATTDTEDPKSVFTFRCGLWLADYLLAPSVSTDKVYASLEKLKKLEKLKPTAETEDITENVKMDLHELNLQIAENTVTKKYENCGVNFTTYYHLKKQSEVAERAVNALLVLIKPGMAQKLIDKYKEVGLGATLGKEGNSNTRFGPFGISANKVADLRTNIGNSGTLLEKRNRLIDEIQNIILRSNNGHQKYITYFREEMNKLRSKKVELQNMEKVIAADTLSISDILLDEMRRNAKTASVLRRNIIEDAPVTIGEHYFNYKELLEAKRTDLDQIFTANSNEVDALPFDQCNRSTVKGMQNKFKEWVTKLRNIFQSVSDSSKNISAWDGVTLNSTTNSFSVTTAGEKLGGAPNKKKIVGILASRNLNIAEIISFNTLTLKVLPNSAINQVKFLRDYVVNLERRPQTWVQNMETMLKEYNAKNEQEKQTISEGVVQAIWKTKNWLKKAKKQLDELFLNDITLIVSGLVKEQVGYCKEALTKCKEETPDSDDDAWSP